ncbi:hypothetical protein OHA72_27185 [Dactylosporangium sp. NBC_01737]|uniref:hypothetical protein n=1 Tax=Dactylosporangium sp. NBC_01737 TaxID=2975959 RepID=UPI002E0D6BAE|nr:hypothetical protein OHA72_27185 [Dactylosporangium sp. NBC_01737]
MTAVAWEVPLPRNRVVPTRAEAYVASTFEPGSAKIAEQAVDVPASVREVTAGFTLRPSCKRGDGGAVGVSVLNSVDGKATLKAARSVE